MRLTGGVLGHPRQAYYAWAANPVSDQDLEDAYLANVLIDTHDDDPEFGYRFLADELERAGHGVGERRVWRLCSAQRLWSTTVRKGRRGAGKSPARRSTTTTCDAGPQPGVRPWLGSWCAWRALGPLRAGQRSASAARPCSARPVVRDGGGASTSSRPVDRVVRCVLDPDHLGQLRVANGAPRAGGP